MHLKHHRLNNALTVGIALIIGCDTPTATTPPSPPQFVQPTTGTIHVIISTSGTDQDTDGYTLSVGDKKLKVASNDTLWLTDALPGVSQMSLDGVAGNCQIDGDQTRDPYVARGTTANVEFAIECFISGGLDATILTTGVGPQGEYSLLMSLAGTTSFVALLPANGKVTTRPVRTGMYRATLLDLIPNCDPVIASPREVLIKPGNPTPVTFEIRCVSPTQIAYVHGDSSNADIYVINSNGTGKLRLTSEPGADVNPAWSPDGSRIAFASARSGKLQIYVMDATGSNVVRLTTNDAADYEPSWSPDGTRIAFVSDRDGKFGIYVMNSDGTNQSRLSDAGYYESDPAWSPDGQRIAFRSNRSSGAGSIYIMSVDGTGVTRLDSSTDPEMQPSWSADGKDIVFTGGTLRDIYVIAADGSNRRLLRSEGSVDRANPDWSPDGRQIAYEEFDCWDYGPCPRAILIATRSGIPYSLQIDDSSEPAWRPR